MAIESIKIIPGVTLVASETEVAGAKRTVTVRLPEGHDPYEFAVGTGAGQASKYYVVQLALAGSASTFDLNATSGGFGDTSLANVKGWAIFNEATNTAHVLTVGNAAATQFPFNVDAGTDTFTVPAGGAVIYAAPLAADGISTSSANNVKFDPGANTFNVTFVVFGE
jgi:hypothetical protein